MKYTKSYVPPTLTVDLVGFQIIESSLSVILINRPEDPFQNEWALPGGYNPEGETTIEALCRIIKNKVGLDINKDYKYLEQLYTFDTVARDPRGHAVSVTYLAGTYDINSKKLKNRAQFYPIFNLPDVAFDHEQIINYAYKRLKSKLLYTNVAYSLLPKKFTLTQMQAVYEIVLNKKLDKRNFRKKIFSMDIIKSIGKYEKVGKHRPAQLYKFKASKLVELQTSFE